MSCFQNSLATKLGKKYVQKTFEWFLVEEKRFLFHVLKDDEVVGYCGGFIPKGMGDGSSSGMLQYAFKEAVRGIINRPWLIFNPEVWAMYPFIFKNIKRRLLGKGKNTSLDTTQTSDRNKYAGLVVIGVHPTYRGTGIYDSLMEYFLKKSEELGAIGCQLSVKKDNYRGLAAYKKFGWDILKENDSTYVLQRIF
jgi:ribosomal protein S18 acetylase RimI-like enzyme